MVHNTHSDQVLEYIKGHPGLSCNRISNAFGRDLHWTIKKLETMNKLKGIPTTSFVWRKKKIYYAA